MLKPDILKSLLEVMEVGPPLVDDMAIGPPAVKLSVVGLKILTNPSGPEVIVAFPVILKSTAPVPKCPITTKSLILRLPLEVILSDSTSNVISIIE